MKQGEFIPEKRLRVSKPEEKNTGEEKQPSLSTRRSFLGNLGKATAIYAIGQVSSLTLLEAIGRSSDLANWLRERAHRKKFEKWSGLPASERERLIDQDVREASAFIRSPEGKRILESGTDEEIFALLQSMPAFLREHVAGTKYDIPKERWPSVSVNSQAPMTAPDIRTVSHAKEIFGGYGNGVITDGMLLTNWHVTSASRLQRSSESDPFAEFHRNYDSGIDAVKIRLPAAFKDERSVYPQSLTLKHDKDINGSFVRIVGIDPDESAAPDGTKLYPSIAIRITKRLAIFLEGTRYWRGRDLLIENSFLFLAPPGESIWRNSASETGLRILDTILDEPKPYQATRMHGMSGSPVLLGGELAGILNQVTEISFKGRCLELGFFHGPDAIRQAPTLDPSKFTETASNSGADYHSDSYESNWGDISADELSEN